MPFAVKRFGTAILPYPPKAPKKEKLTALYGAASFIYSPSFSRKTAFTVLGSAFPFSSRMT